MPSREPELYKDKIEVSLDGRQIFYLFFGGAVIVGLVFVVGVMVGRRVESRGHLDRADTQAANDPLAALDRLERADNLSFHGALTGGEQASDVEKAIGELEKRRAAGKADKGAAVSPELKLAKPEAKPDAKPEGKPEARPGEAKPEVRTDRSEGRSEARAEKLDGKSESVTKAEADKPKAEADKPKADKHDGERRSKKHDDGSAEARPEARSESKPDRSEAKRSDARSDKPVTKPDGKSEDRRDARAEGRAESTEGKARAGTDAKSGTEGKVRFTLQLSSFQDKAEAEAFLSAMKAAGFQANLTEADVGGKGTFYRVRLGSFRSLEAASEAKAEYDKTAKKPAQVMRL